MRLVSPIMYGSMDLIFQQNWKFTRRTTEQKTRGTFKKTSEKKIKNQKKVGAIALHVHSRIDCLIKNLHNTPYAVTVSGDQLRVRNSLAKKFCKLSGRSARVLFYFYANE